jgi:hypothetical protein
MLPNTANVDAAVHIMTLLEWFFFG